MTAGGTANTSTRAPRAAMVERILATTPLSAPVQAALRTVPRERFLPGLPAEETHRAAARRGYEAWASTPATVTVMLDQLDVQPGDRILEIGAPDGYSTALLSVLTGRCGTVLTTDFDPAAIRGNTTGLHTLCHSNITVVGGDLTARPHLPYDRVLLHDPTGIHPALAREVADGGRLVLPLRLRGLERTVAFTRDRDLLVSDSIRPVPGHTPRPRRTAVFLTARARLDAAGHDVDPAALRDAVRGPQHLVRTGVTLPALLIPRLDLALATTQPVYGRLYLETVSDQRAPLGSPYPGGVSAVWTRDTLTFLDLEPHPDNTVEIRAAAYGPDRHRTADLLAYDVQIWDSQRREGPDPRIRIHPPSSAGDTPRPGQMVTAARAQVVLGWE
ncbi:protein-L-isoaspartate(D-aspartate) O-methyltransferase [Parafrankia irregularis]|uniref:Protein-L-isoaspartate O-methyltransferase n=1 Tax=Parafrankia irregularis TaxID=795642 RepID=A0A0S4R080_9ACTN|nr:MULTISPECIES: hypothetical protein [Frankiaceae]KPM53155.1 hypothetical protein ACG83_27760 [Frankia sp. R43]MBE3204681.1 methyltransferase, FxLD system [Parafrankia sp. CH37]CUU60620.1 protein-L-isoaspartate(D-aspartate) O-methyltransferase [Parafrankia irregularis]